MNNQMTTLLAPTQLALRFGKWARNGKLTYSNRVIAVENLEDASRKWEMIRDAADFGASNCPIVVVVDLDSGEDIAKISYNGRVWGEDGKEIRIAQRKTAAEHGTEGWRDFTCVS